MTSIEGTAWPKAQRWEVWVTTKKFFLVGKYK